MPHFIVEYTANLEGQARIPDLLRKAVDVLTAEGYPLHGMRARGLKIDQYLLADGKRDYVMVHGILKVAPGHTAEHKKRTCEVVFGVMKAHFTEAFAGRYFMLSLEMIELVSGDGSPTLKYSNVGELTP